MATFTEDEYQVLLSTMTAASTDPVLSPTEIKLALKLSRIVDDSALLPTDLLWEPTYDLNFAALQCWKWKMGKASDLSVARTGDLTLEDNVIVKNIEMMIDQYRRAVSGAVAILPAGLLVGDTAIDGDI